MGSSAAALTTPDSIVLIACAVLAVRGAVKGFAWQAVRTVGLIGALWGATTFHEPIGTWLDRTFEVVPSIAAPLLSWLLLLIGILLLGGYLAHAARGLVRTTDLSGVDRVLGLGLGAVMGLVLCAAGFVVWGKFTDEDQLRSTMKGSISARYMAHSVELLEPFFPDFVRTRFGDALDALNGETKATPEAG